MTARIEAGMPDGAMTEVEIGATLRDVAELYEPLAEQKGIALVVEAKEPITLKASRELLGQALANLVDNAIKHAPPNGGTQPPLRIVVSAKREAGQLVLSVADNGFGGPEVDRERGLHR